MPHRESCRISTVAPIGFGTAELVPDPSRSSGWVLLIDGVAQSYVDLDDPSHLEFPYVRQIALAVEAFFGATGGAPVTDRPGACGATAEHGAPLRVLHLGGGGLTLPRYLAAARPGVRQVVVEHDELLLDLVLELLPLPDGHEVRIELGNAAQAVLAAPDATFDLVISDAYEGVQMSLDVATAQFAAELARILRPHGLCVVNVADDPPLAFSRVQAATLRETFAEVCLLTTAKMLGGRRSGNVVLAASSRQGGLPIRSLQQSLPADGQMLAGEDLLDFIGETRPLSARQPIAATASGGGS